MIIIETNKEEEEEILYTCTIDKRDEQRYKKELQEM